MSRAKREPYLHANYLTGAVELVTKWEPVVAPDGSKRKNIVETVDVTDEFQRIVHDKEHQRARAKRACASPAGVDA
jgi:hypothetical protein